MSSTTIYFLTKNAQSIEEAENLVSSYLDTENFFDYFCGNSGNGRKSCSYLLGMSYVVNHNLFSHKECTEH